MNKIFHHLRENSRIERVINYCSSASLPGCQGVPINKMAIFFIESMKKGIIFHRAAAMTYRIFIAIIPIIMALFSVISYLSENIQLTILNFAESVVPSYVWPAISNMITEVVTKQNGTRLYISFFLGLTLAVISVNAVLNILNTTYYQSKQRSFFKQIGIALLICFCALITVIVASGIFIAAEIGFNYIDNHLFQSNGLYYTVIQVFKWLLLLSVMYISISAFYYIAPPEHKQYRFFSAGATLASIFTVLILGIMNLYFANFGNFNVIYGSLGAIFAIMLWIYWNSIFLLIGFDLNVSIVVAKKTLSNNTPKIK
ncbi:MAG: YihY/virulence factor BrkB family protein [Bacteroidales bacterium]|nr:YihY/virulence factor BrkB family protein [Bacteroidales bacterium]